MGEGAKPLMFRSCPVGTVLTDEVSSLLAAYNLKEAFGDDPPGRRDPRVLEAFLTIKSVHSEITREETQK